MTNEELISKLLNLPLQATMVVNIEDYEHEFEWEGEENLDLVEWSDTEKKIYLVSGRRKNDRGRTPA